MKKNKVMVRKADYNNCVEIIEEIFSKFPLDLKGKKVVIKPNVVHSRKSSEHFTTDPVVLKAVVELVKCKNPLAIWVGDNPGLLEYGYNKRAFEITGLYEASCGHYVNFGAAGVLMPYPESPYKTVVSKHILEADVVISLPKFKTHGLGSISGALKNHFGIITGGCKAVLHQYAENPKNIQKMIIDCFSYRPADLYIIDGIVGMEGQGPSSIDLRHDVKHILASYNPVAIDATMARMMGLEPKNIPSIALGKQYGFGNYEPEYIELDGELVVIPNYKPAIIPTYGYNAVPGAREIMDNNVAEKPTPNKALCIGCGLCSYACPVKCLPLVSGYPKVNKIECLHCHVCKEICPHQALDFI